MTEWRALHIQPTRELLIVSPYFVPRKDGVAWLSGLTARGTSSPC